MKYAGDGDNVYLPGANFSQPGNGLLIKKRLNIIGAGHYPDSTRATGPTVISGDVRFLTAGSSSTLQGVYISGNILFGIDEPTAAAKNILISRCNVSSIMLSVDGGTFQGAESVFIKDNVIRESISFAQVKNVVVENNIMEGTLTQANGSVIIRNNIFLRRTTYLISYFENCRLESNIFIRSSNFFYGSSAGNVFYNNVFIEGDPLGASFSWQNKFSVTNLFVDQSGPSFSYLQNYHLNGDSPARNAGFDGTDCGIYGGANPYKEGAVPRNPHIRTKSLPASTDTQGKLNVQVTVAAQNN
jgi:hypothetical protein